MDYFRHWTLEEKTEAKVTCCSDISNYLSDNGIIVCSNVEIPYQI